MKSLRIYCVVFVFLSNYEAAFSQRFYEREANRQDERTQEEQQHQVYFEASNFISDSIGKSRLDISFRIPQDFFVFVRNLSDPKSSPFVATGDITVEILDSANISVGRELLTKELGANEPEAHDAEPKFLQGFFSFHLPPGEYTIVTEVKDHESSHRYFDKDKKIVLKDFSRSTMEFSDVVFVEQSNKGDDSALAPVNLGGNVPFGKNFDACVEFATDYPTDSLLVFYNIFKINNQVNERTYVEGDTLH